jgi:hypothetical protein
MSTMLEQAIIDAAALRETAMKSAEKSLIEKYSQEFKNTFDKLLEQEMQQDPSAEPSSMPDTSAQTEPVEDPMADLSGEEQGLEPEKKNVFDKVKTAFFELDGDDDEMITINFDGLKAKKVGNSSLLASPASALSSQPATPAPTPAPAAEPAAALQESLDLDLDSLKEEIHVALGEMYGASGKGYHNALAGDEEELDLELDEAGNQEDSQVKGLENTEAAKRELASRKREEAARFDKEATLAKQQKDTLVAKLDKKEEEPTATTSSMYEEIELSEEELLELEESLTIDMKNVPEGYMGTHDRKDREFKKVALAKARGDKERKRREHAKKTVGDLELQEAVQKIGTKYIKQKEKTDSLYKSNKELVSVVQTLKEQLEQINLSNAKLLYTNKVLSNNSLNERQKQQVVENIAKAGNVVEAKAIYETLQSTVQSINKEKMPKSLSEALNRGPSPFLVRKRETSSLDDLQTERMKRLAGIK